jgi:hypothetical protein
MHIPHTTNTFARYDEPFRGLMLSLETDPTHDCFLSLMSDFVIFPAWLNVDCLSQSRGPVKADLGLLALFVYCLLHFLIRIDRLYSVHLILLEVFYNYGIWKSASQYVCKLMKKLFNPFDIL